MNAKLYSRSFEPINCLMNSGSKELGGWRVGGTPLPIEQFLILFIALCTPEIFKPSSSHHMFLQTLKNNYLNDTIQLENQKGQNGL